LARQSAGEFARIYKENSLEGGHVIKLGPGNDEATLDALSSWPGSIQTSIMGHLTHYLAKLRWAAGRRWDQ